MRLIKLAFSYLRQAEARVRDAEDAYDDKNYPYTVRLSQEAVELCLKACLRLVGIEYPKVHDVSEILLIYIDRFPEWYKKEIDFLAEASKVLAKKREISFYGGEDMLLSPEDLISKTDASDAVYRARKTLDICKKFIQEYEARHKH